MDKKDTIYSKDRQKMSLAFHKSTCVISITGHYNTCPSATEEYKLHKLIKNNLKDILVSELYVDIGLEFVTYRNYDYIIRLLQTISLSALQVSSYVFFMWNYEHDDMYVEDVLEDIMYMYLKRYKHQQINHIISPYLIYDYKDLLDNRKEKYNLFCPMIYN